MPDSDPIAALFVKDYRVMIATLNWADGTHRTIATNNPADLLTIGILARGDQPPPAFDEAFKGKLVEEPKGMVDVLQIAVQRSDN